MAHQKTSQVSFTVFVPEWCVCGCEWERERQLSYFSAKNNSDWTFCNLCNNNCQKLAQTLFKGKIIPKPFFGFLSNDWFLSKNNMWIKIEAETTPPRSIKIFLTIFCNATLASTVMQCDQTLELKVDQFYPKLPKKDPKHFLMHKERFVK